MTGQSLSIDRGFGSSRGYTGFNRLVASDVRLGALGHGGGVDLASIRRVDSARRHASLGTDTFAAGELPSDLEALVVARNLAPGQ